jgi:Na+/melibiose symporter-like transporter
MIFCDLGRMLIYGLVPVGWVVIGPQIWLIYCAAAGGSVLGAFFQVSYITAVANLVTREQITDANGRLQVTTGIVFVLGPMLAGFVSAQFGSTAAISIDAISFAISALSLTLVKLKPTQPNVETSNGKAGLRSEWLEGVKFLFGTPILRNLMILLALSSLLVTATLDLFIFHLKHDLGQDDNAVGLVLGLSSVGAIIGGLSVAYLRRKLGFGVCFLGGFALSGLVIIFIGIANALLIIAPLAMLYLLGDTVRGILSMSLRQQITPDHLLGRVTAIYWVLTTAPGPIGAAICTALAEQIGASAVLIIIGLFSISLAFVGGFTSIRYSKPEQKFIENQAILAKFYK